MNKHYLYTHYREDKNEVFYIGIGTKNSQDLKYNSYTRAYNKNKRTSYWKNIISLNPDYKVSIILESDSYEEIKLEEIRLIKLYGRRDLNLGSLCNMTDGGDGQINRVWSKESRTKASISHTGKVLSASHIDNIKKHLYGNKSHLGRIFTKEHRDNISKAGKGKTPWNKDRVLSEEEIQSIKNGIQVNKKLCSNCGFYFDSGNYTKWHGEKCLIGSIKEYIPQIKEMYNRGIKILRISNILNLNYKSVYKLKQNNLL